MSEQLKLLGNILEFPKDRYNKRKKESDRKYMHMMIDLYYDNDCKFEIIIDKENAKKIYNDPNNKIPDFAIITTDKNRKERINTKKLNSAEFGYMLINK